MFMKEVVDGEQGRALGKSNDVECRAPKFLVNPLEGLSIWQNGRSWNLEHDPDFQH
jgi:hypothetical protein